MSTVKLEPSMPRFLSLVTVIRVAILAVVVLLIRTFISLFSW